jgi:hypothetical protein
MVREFETTRNNWVKILRENPDNTEAAQMIISLNSKLPLIRSLRPLETEARPEVKTDKPPPGEFTTLREAILWLEEAYRRVDSQQTAIPRDDYIKAGIQSAKTLVYKAMREVTAFTPEED